MCSQNRLTNKHEAPYWGKLDKFYQGICAFKVLSLSNWSTSLTGLQV